MDTNKQLLRDYFNKLGLASELADIYGALLGRGPSTISELARRSNVERTRIYRVKADLQASGLIEVEKRYKKEIWHAAPIEALQNLIAVKQAEVQSLMGELQSIEQLFKVQSMSSPATKVKFYEGKEGIRQMLWNELKTKSEIVCYNYRVLEEGTGVKFMQNWTEEFERRGLSCRFLGGKEFGESWIEGAYDGTATGGRVGGMDYRYIDPKHFSFKHSCDVYDNVVAYYNYVGADIFGVEIINQDIADVQRQMFELLWIKSEEETRY